MTLDECKGLPLCYVKYQDLCQHSSDVAEMAGSHLKILEMCGRTILTDDPNGTIKCLNILDRSDGADSQWMTVPLSDVVEIVQLEMGKKLYDKKTASQKMSRSGTSKRTQRRARR